MRTDKPKQCFVVMPFSDTVHTYGDNEICISAKQWNHIYENWIKKAIESVKEGEILCKRSPSLPGNFIKGIVQDLAGADLVIADVTGSKPNVYYELGIRHSLKIGTIIITQDIKSLPSDLNSYYAFEYKYSDSASEYEELYGKFEKELHEKIKNFGLKGSLSDSPVSDFLGFRAYLLDKQGYEDKEMLKWMLSACKKAMNENFNTCNFLYKAFTEGKEIELKSWPVLDTYPLETLYSHIYMYQWKLISSELGFKLAEFIREHRKLMLSVEQHWEIFRITNQDEAANYLVTILKYVCEEREPEIMKQWAELEEAIEKICLSVVYKCGTDDEKVIATRKFQKHDF